MIFSVSNKGGRGLRPGVFPILGMLCFPLAGWAGAIGTEIKLPARDAVVLSVKETAAATAASAVLPVALRSPDRLAKELRGLIDLSRTTGSPRPLGLAVGLLNQLPQDRWTPDVYLMRATIHQRLHRFDQAEADLARVLKAQPDNRQAWLTRYSIAMVRNDLVAAELACNKLAQPRPGLLSASCTQELASLGAQPRQAYDLLRQRLDVSGSAGAIERDYALITLAEMASRLGLPEADGYWQRGLLQAPDDLYRRARYADWLLAQGRPAEVLVITDGFNEIDTLAVLRAIALTRLDDPQQPGLVSELDERFREARWRGENLHHWEYARFLLDVKGDADAALEMALANWETQRAHPDRELLIRAAARAGKSPNFAVELRDGESTL
ncbi:tetratricopeptide repeat protein [Halopseudomonas salina]|uniref:Tetratricopeptide repeat-containing protein n=1 Tax=Halopseudomonas salina TaxID=1323744 RepID=A0ABQ1P4V6_9GAMM|nr:tetratricopeptide repeat protein [Halopseudomonas salina]GGC91164.1 hypothetical protein GCM10007418_08550 [Halopseudomonas salina]